MSAAQSRAITGFVVGFAVKPVGERSAGNPHAAFDERGRETGHSHRARPRLYVRPEGANHQWRKISPGELSIVPVADERPGRVTGLVEAS
jgi:hypothetical protein